MYVCVRVRVCVCDTSRSVSLESRYYRKGTHYEMRVKGKRGGTHASPLLTSALRYGVVGEIGMSGTRRNFEIPICCSKKEISESISENTLTAKGAPAQWPRVLEFLYLTILDAAPLATRGLQKVSLGYFISSVSK